MGAANVLPTIPNFVAGSPAASDLNNLSYAVSFLLDHGTRPTWKFVSRGTGLTMSAATWTAIPWDTEIYDSDNVGPGTGTWTAATIVTQGYYHVEGAVQPQNQSTRVNFAMAFKWTAGASSPYTSSSPGWFGYRASNMSVSTTAAATCGGIISAITPFPMYPGDTIQTMAFVSGSTAPTLEINDNSAYMSGRFSMQFTGRWLRMGT